MDNDRFERLAAEFHRKHRILAPGKDEPAAGGETVPDEERWRLWWEFLEVRRKERRVARVIRKNRRRAAREARS